MAGAGAGQLPLGLAGLLLPPQQVPVSLTRVTMTTLATLMPPPGKSRKTSYGKAPPGEVGGDSDDEGSSGGGAGVDARRLRAVKKNYDSRVQALNDYIGTGGRGRPASETQVILALKGALMWDWNNEPEVTTREPTLSDRVKAGAALSGLNADTVSAKVYNFLNTGNIPIEDTSLRGAGAANYPAQAPLPPDIEEIIKEWVDDLLSNTESPKWITRLTIQNKIRELTGVHCSYRRITRLAAKWGLAYQKLVPQTTEGQSAVSLLQRRIYLQRLRNAYQNGWEVVYMDQSYSNMRCKAQMSFAPRDRPQSVFARKAGPGPRLCIQHVLDGRTGLLGASFVPSTMGDIDSKSRNAEVLFRADGRGNTEDYHGNFDRGVFLRTVHSRILPALKAFCPAACNPNPTQRVVLVVDNAKYQITSTPCLDPDLEKGEFLRFNPLKLNRGPLVQAMLDLGVKELDTRISWTEENDEGEDVLHEKIVRVTMNEDEQGRKGRPGDHPSLLELQLACLDYLLNNSEKTLMNDLEFELSRIGNFVVLYNAPYFSWGMLIEMVWSQAKGFWLYTSNEGGVFSEMVDAIRSGLYTADFANEDVCKVHGGLFVRDPVTSECESSKKLLKHMLYGKTKSIQVQIECDPVLRGDGEEPCTFDNFILPPEEIALLTGCFTRFATDHKLKKYLEEKGEEDVEEQAQDLEEETEGEDDD
jgi:hypothetical protein